MLITSNQYKYKGDGIMNGAREYVQDIQVSKENLNRVGVIWIVFNNENLKKLYRLFIQILI